MVGAVVHVEWRNLRRDRTFLALVGGFALLGGYVSVDAGRAVARERVAIAAEIREEAARFAALRVSVAAIASGAPVHHATDPRDPLIVGRDLGRRLAILPPGDFAPISVGQRDVLPHRFTVTTLPRFLDEENESAASPLRRASGPFDLAFVFVFLLPLVVVALTYDLLSGERERGTLAIVLSQPVTLSSFLLGKAFVRAAALLAVVFVVGLLGLLAGGRASAIGPAAVQLVLLIGLLAAYASFWFAAALAANAWGRSSDGNALWLLGVWLLVLVVVPGLAGVAVDLLHPSPSRGTLVNLTRAAAADAEAEASELEGDHGREDAVQKKRTPLQSLDVQEEIERRVLPVVATFRDQLARQQAAVDRLRFLSPAVLLQEGLNEIAGSSVARHQHFVAQVDRFHAAVKRFHFDLARRGRSLGTAEYDAMQAFQYQEQPPEGPRRRVLSALAAPVLFTGALTVLALLGLRKPLVAD